MSITRRLSLLVFLLFLLTHFPGNASQPVAVAETNDTPTALAYDTLTDFSLGNGLLYWANACPGGEFRGPGYLKRMPAGGGPSTTLATTAAAQCATFYAMAVAPEGIYYYGPDQTAILFRPTANPFDPPTVVLASLDAVNGPTTGSNLSIMGDYIYWGSYSLGTSTARIHRVHKNGSGHQILYTGGGIPTSVLATWGVVAYLEPNGLYFVPVCSSPPCGRTQLSTVGGRDLHYHPGSTLTAFQLYWTDYNTNPDRIMRAGCNGLLALPGVTPSISCAAATSPYSAPDNTWYIGQPRTASGNLYWTERQSGMGPTNGRIRRLPISGGAVADILTNARQLDLDLYTDTLYVYFATRGNDAGGLQGGIYRLPLNASAIVRDLRSDWFEVTQGIQNRGNTVPLTAGKTTYVRGYGLQGSGPNTAMVSAVLHGARGGTPLPGSPLTPLNGTLSLATGAAYDRGNLNQSWLFQLPGTWTAAGTVAFRLEVDPSQAYPDPNRANNSASQNLIFVGKAPVCNVFVPVRTHAPRPSTSDPNFGAFVNMATRLWPTRAYWSYYQTSDVAELEACWWGPFPYPCYGPYELPDDSWRVLLSLKTRDIFSDDPDQCDDAGGYTHYVGMVHPSTNTGTTNGAAYYNSSATWVVLPPHSPTTSGDFDFPRKGGTLAHELGHNAGRKHVACGGAPDADSGYPYPVSQIAPVGQNSYYGFDVRTRTVIAPDAVADLMGYCQPRWTSDYTWRAFFNWLGAGAASAASADESLTAAAGAVYVSGGVAATGGSGTLRYAYVYPTSLMSSGMLAKWSATALQAAAADATYQVRVRDASNAVLATQAVTPLVAPDAPAGQTLGFAGVFAAPGGNAAKLELLENGNVIATLAMGPAIPTVTVVKPAAGETVDDLLRVEWQASDANSEDILQYTVQYSPDNGATWISLVSDYGHPDTETKLFQLEQPDIPATAGPNQGRIRVLASDGYNTDVGTSAGFTVPNRTPHAYILSPAPGESFAADQPITLSGFGMDVEDGALEGGSLIWTLGLTPFGTGTENTYTGVPPGEYPIGLAAVDSKGAIGVTTATLHVAPLSVPLAGAPSLDGYCTDDAYTAAVEVPLFAYSAGQQASVRLLRSGNYLWACFSDLKPGAATPGSSAALTIDPNLSRDPMAQADDYGFFVAENGGVYSLKGTGGGAFVLDGPGGFEAQVARPGDRWSAELRIHKDAVGGWDRMVGLAAGHHNVGAANDNYLWPLFAARARPDTWARTALGDLPHISSLSPDTVTAGNPEFTLTVKGSGLTASSVVLWDGDPLATTFDSASQVRAQVPAARVAAAGGREVSVRASNTSPLTSNHLLLTVVPAAPNLADVSPNSCNAGAAAFTMTASGTGFTAESRVLWNGEALATTFVNSTQLKALVPAPMVANGYTASVAVHSGGPDGGSTSNTVSFTVQPQVTPPMKLYLPYLQR